MKLRSSPNAIGDAFSPIDRNYHHRATIRLLHIALASIVIDSRHDSTRRLNQSSTTATPHY